jgi:hypothetical protein
VRCCVAGKTLKDLMTDYMDKEIEEFCNKQNAKIVHMPMSERRIIITHAAAISWKKVQKEKKNLLMRSFQGPGLLMPIKPSAADIAAVRPQGMAAFGKCMSHLHD